MSQQLNHNGEVAAIILGGGESVRMGCPKILLPYNDKRTFLEQIISEYQMVPGIQTIFVCNEDALQRYTAQNKIAANVNVVSNSSSSSGRMYSIHLGLAHTCRTKVFIQNIDNPFITHRLLLEMIENSPDNGFVSPRVNNNGGHPVLICGDTLQEIKSTSIHVSLRNVLEKQRRVDVESTDARLLANINSPDDYAQYFPASSMLT